MIREKVSLKSIFPQNNNLQPWAANFINSHPYLLALSLCKVTRRREALAVALGVNNKIELLELLDCNKSGDLVFMWSDSTEKQVFMDRWNW